MPVPPKEAISDSQRDESGDRLVILNSQCSSASTSTVSNNAFSTNNGVFHEERLQLRDKLIRRGEGITELVDTKYSFKQKENTYKILLS